MERHFGEDGEEAGIACIILIILGGCDIGVEGIEGEGEEQG